MNQIWVIGKKYHLVASGKIRTFCGLPSRGQQLPVANWTDLAESLRCQKCQDILEVGEREGAWQRESKPRQ